MKILLFFLFMLSLLVTSVHAKDITMRVAVLDSPNMPPELWTWLQYEKAYLRGLEAARFVAKKDHINIVYKNFFYGNGPLDIINEIPKVNAWHPDFILGPHYSNQFLLLKRQFKDILVLSSYASDKAIYDMPNNFYSLFPPDNVSVQAIADFINSKFHTKNILIISRADCKDCNSMSELFTRIYSRINPNIKIHQNNFVGGAEDVSDPKVLLKDYQEGDIIVMILVSLYDDTYLTTRLIPFMSSDPIFISFEDNWGNPNNGLPISSKMGITVKTYLANPFYLDMSSTTFRTFTESYLSLYGAYPNEVVSYVTFMTLISAVESFKDCSLKHDTSMNIRQKILSCYLHKLNHDSNWFRLHKYAIYQLEPGTGELVETRDMSSFLPKTISSIS